MSSDRQSSSNTTWHASRVSPHQRVASQGHPGLCVWLTGLSGAGKSSIAMALEQQLVTTGVRAFVLDGDNIRHGLCGDLGFSAEDRAENIRRVAEVARLFVDAGVVVIAAFISPCAKGRSGAREIIGVERCVEVWVRCPLVECERRDPKGLYAKVRAGEITYFTGIDAPYDVPLDADLIVDTTCGETPDESAQRIRRALGFDDLHAHAHVGGDGCGRRVLPVVE